MNDVSDKLTALTFAEAPVTLGRGACKAYLVSGKVKFACSCPGGIFKVDGDGKLTQEYQFCCHELKELKEHADIKPAEPNARCGKLADSALSESTVTLGRGACTEHLVSGKVTFACSCTVDSL